MTRSSRRWLVLLITSLAAFMAFLDATIVNIAFPAIRRSFPDTSLAGLSWVLNAYNIAFAALLVPAGRVADRVGRKRSFLAGLLTFTAASALCATAPSAATLVALRVLQALGAAVIIPTCIALLLPEFPRERRATAVALLGAVAAVAAAGGPSLGGLIVDAASWRWIFLVNLPIGLLAWGLGRRVLAEARDPEPGAFPDVAGIVLLAAAVGLIALGLVKSTDWGFADGRVLVALGGGAALLPALWWRSASRAAPALELGLLRIRSVAVSNASTLALAAGFYAKIFCDVLFLSAIWGYSPLQSGLAITPGPLVTAAVAGPAGRLADRFGPRALIAPGAAIYAGGCAWYALRAGTSPSYVNDWLPGALLTGIGCGMSLPILTSSAVAEVPPARFGTGSALNSMARQLGAVVGIAVLVAIVGRPGEIHGLSAFDAGWLYTASAALLAAVAALALRPRALAGPPTISRATAQQASSPLPEMSAAIVARAGGPAEAEARAAAGRPSVTAR
ncbi:MAG: MFS transporter [Actinobacteria bacterium]|nr:MAG: MFS transporter [Actinomycetota bacterium]